MVLESDEDLFDVLEDDAFSDDGMLTTTSSGISSPSSFPSSLSSSALSSPSSSAPASPVPSTPPFPGQASSPPSPVPSSVSFPSSSSPSSSYLGQPLGVSVTLPLPDDPVPLVHIHIWSLLQQ